mmetsp:Transcript_16147/g.46582  ORF Transcript_16147/g.46582 Transcript_16147/m.46582 type:complete len:85 (-) Transcript_16147:1639-1893(-)
MTSHRITLIVGAFLLVGCCHSFQLNAFQPRSDASPVTAPAFQRGRCLYMGLFEFKPVHGGVVEKTSSMSSWRRSTRSSRPGGDT